MYAIRSYYETYRHTNLRNLKPGSKVNLERAMAAGGRFGGHIVQGHVDGTGTIANMRQDQNAVFVEIEPSEPALFKYIIPQGSITIDGISLTVASVEGGRFMVSIIPHTWSETVLALKRAGDTVNLETDVLGKYMEHLLRFSNSPAGHSQKGNPSNVDLSFLVENGFA